MAKEARPGMCCRHEYVSLILPLANDLDKMLREPK